ncbi:MAG: hypothetical protein KDK30_02305 [Leptospiraceae bacterium]|nr:hypothetical protein [Leptospiraceae bacterium]
MQLRQNALFLMPGIILSIVLFMTCARTEQAPAQMNEWQMLVCDRLAEVQFEQLVPGSRAYRPRVILKQPADLESFCAAIQAGAPDYTSSLSRQQPWAWVGFFAADGNQLASITLLNRNDPAYLMLAASGSRYLTASETETVIDLIKHFDPLS